MEKERVVRYILILILIVVLAVIGYTKIKDLLPLWNPLLNEKTRLVRYYACSLAICTKGCGNPILQNKDCSKGDCLCLERDPSTKECTKWCQDVCDENPGWGDGKHCGEDYYINLTLKSPIDLKGCYKREKNKPVFVVRPLSIWNFFSNLVPTGKTIINPSFDFGETCYTEVDDILNVLGRTENFTWELMNSKCIKQDYDFYWTGLTKVFVDIGAIDEEGATKYGTGWIYLNPIDASEKYKCFSGKIGCPGLSRTLLNFLCHGCPGFYECNEFKGTLKIWSFDPEGDGCADVIIRDADKPFTGGFDFWVEYQDKKVEEEIKIPIGQKADFNVFIKNNLGFDSSFTLKVKYPEDANCNFEGDEDQASIYIEKDKQDFKKLTCEPKKVGTYDIDVIGWDGSITLLAPIRLAVGDFNLFIKKDGEIAPEEEIETYVNTPRTLYVYVENKLGKDANFDLSLSADSNLNCLFDSTHSVQMQGFSVVNGKTEKTSFTCTPGGGTEGNSYTVTVTGINDTLSRSNTTKIKVNSCQPPSGDLTVTLTSTTSGKETIITASGYKNCPNINAQFTVSLLTDDGKKVKVGDINSPQTKEANDVFIEPTLGSPGKYVFKAEIDFDGNNIYEKSGETEVDVVPDYPNSNSCNYCEDDKGNNKWCAFAFGVCNAPTSSDICDFCGWPHGSDCNFACNPQSCYQEHVEGKCAGASNICCIDNSDVYSPGPTDIPCLSPDTNTHDTKSDYFAWNEVSKARNVLVDDNVVETSCDHYGNCYATNNRGSYATFSWNVFCGKDSDCNSPYFETKCVDIPDDGHPDGVKEKRACIIDGLDDNYWFTSWLYIKISYSGRPVYGVKIHASDGDLNQYKTRDWLPYFSINEKFELFLHNNSGWFHIASPIFTGASTKTFKPTNDWAWEGIDAILLAHKYNFEWWWNGGAPPYTYHEIKSDSWIDYIGLLTKDPSNTSFCTEGSSTPFYRTVDNGVKCYWGLACREKSGNEGETGWGYLGSSEGIKPLQGLSDACDCSENYGQCGKGFCNFLLGGKQYCYYGVKCAHGGWWPEHLKECKLSEFCTSEGCKPS